MTIAETTRTIVPHGAWRLDAERSRVEWKVEGEKNHHGRFGAFDGTVTPTRIEGVVQSATVEADDPGLTAHLRSPDFLGAEQNPEIRFVADEIEHAGGDVFTIRGAVTIGPVTQPVELSARADGTPRVRATGTVAIGDVSATVLVDAELVAA
jgi:polyisoprenoid-binding protein YceI